MTGLLWGGTEDDTLAVFSTRDYVEADLDEIEYWSCKERGVITRLTKRKFMAKVTHLARPSV